MSSKLLTILASLGLATALRPNGTSVCDYYTPLVIGQPNSPATQQQLMTLVVHTIILGNYTNHSMGVKVDGIASAATYNGHKVNLLPYFTGGYASSNLGGKAGVKNDLDDGGAVPLLASKPANGTNSNQYRLLTNLYGYFGEFFGCTQQGSDDFPKYQGASSMWKVHRFMDLNVYEVGYFIEQAALAAQSLGMEDADVTATRDALNETFNYRCAPAVTLIPAEAGPQLQTICADNNTCPLALNSTCSAYDNNGMVNYPAIADQSQLGGVPKENDTTGANGSTIMPSMAMGGSPTGGSGSGTSGTSPTASSTSGNKTHSNEAPVQARGLGLQMLVLTFMAGIFAMALAA